MYTESCQVFGFRASPAHQSLPIYGLFPIAYVAHVVLISVYAIANKKSVCRMGCLDQRKATQAALGYKTCKIQ